MTKKLAYCDQRQEGMEEECIGSQGTQRAVGLEEEEKEEETVEKGRRR